MWCAVVGLLLAASATASEHPAPLPAAVVQWLRDHGGFVHGNVTVARSSARGWALVATGHVAPDVEVLRIPTAVVVQPSQVLDLYPDWVHLRLSEEALVGLFLAVERRHGPLRRTRRRTLLAWMLGHWHTWGPYLDALPALPPLNAALWRPRDWAVAQRFFAPMSPLPSAADVYRVHLEATRFVEHIALSEREFAWGYGLALSRSFEGAMLMPLVDFANHGSSGPQLRIMRDPFSKTLAKAVARGALRWCVDRPAHAGDEIFLHYGQRRPIDWLVSYGFLPERDVELQLSNETLADCAQLASDLPSSDMLRWRALVPALRTALKEHCRAL